MSAGVGLFVAPGPWFCFEFVGGKSDKFWRIRRNPSAKQPAVTVWWGRNGTRGQAKEFVFASSHQAINYCAARISEKTSEGYKRVLSATTKNTAGDVVEIPTSRSEQLVDIDGDGFQMVPKSSVLVDPPLPVGVPMPKQPAAIPSVGDRTVNDLPPVLRPLQGSRQILVDRLNEVLVEGQGRVLVVIGGQVVPTDSNGGMLTPRRLVELAAVGEGPLSDLMFCFDPAVLQILRPQKGQKPKPLLPLPPALQVVKGQQQAPGAGTATVPISGTPTTVPPFAKVRRSPAAPPGPVGDGRFAFRRPARDDEEE